MELEGYSFTCCICKQKITDEMSHNPFPVYNMGECCDLCNETVVIPIRKRYFINQK